MPVPVTGRGTCLGGGASRASRASREAETRGSVLLPAPGRGSPGCGSPARRESTAMPDRSSHGSQLQHLRVRDCMHAGVLTCSADTPLVEVAGIMTKHRVHAVAVIDDKRRPIGVVSALDVVAAASETSTNGDRPRRYGDRASRHDLHGRAAGPRREADDKAPRSPPDRCRSGQRLPSGILSTLDIAVLVAENSERWPFSLESIEQDRRAATPEASIAPRIRRLRTETGRPRARRPLLRPANAEELALARVPEQTRHLLASVKRLPAQPKSCAAGTLDVVRAQSPVSELQEPGAARSEARRRLPRFSRNRRCEDPSKASAYDPHPAICVP